MLALFFQLLSLRALFRLACISLLVAALAPATYATHIVGGEMELQYKSGTTYTLVLNLYFDAVNGNAGALDRQMTAGIFDKATNRRMQDVTLEFISNTFVNYTNPACTQPTLSTRKLVYSQDITLSAATYTSTSGYYAAVERCCRNNGISNIQNPAAAGQTFYLEFPAVVRNGQTFRDSTPRIFPPLSDYACLGELFYYDFGGTDADQDSLVYDMVTPLNGHSSTTDPAPNQALSAPYTTITWKTGLSTQQQLPGAPTMSIDARTGRLTVRPTQVGLFVFGVRCTEYRQGVKIGETRRDFQLFVLNCVDNAAPSLALYTAGRTQPYVPGQDTLWLGPGQTPCLQVRFTDSDPGSQLTVAVRPVNFNGPVPTWSGATSGTVRAAGSPDTLQATLCFSPCQDTQGKVLLLDIIVADNGCSLPKLDTVRVAFTAQPALNTPAVLTSSFPLTTTDAPALIRVPVGSEYTASLLGTDADGNPLTLSAAGQGFELAAAEMEFTAQNGTGQATGSFRWQATCENTKAGEEVTVLFQLQESAICQAQPVTMPVRFVLVAALDTVAFLPPNIITPNGDGRNDVFTLPDLPADFCNSRFAGIQIFSRWGREVYHSSTRAFSWGGAGLAGTYYYLITYTDGRRYKGWVEVAP